MVPMFSVDGPHYCCLHFCLKPLLVLLCGLSATLAFVRVSPKLKPAETY